MPYKSNSALVERILSAPGVLSIVHGPAGYGKTVLLEEIRQSLAKRGSPSACQVEEAEALAAAPWLIIDDSDTTSLSAEQLRHALDRADAAQTGIVIATRSIDSLPLARIRAEGRVLRFGPKQIGISHKDSVSLLSSVIDKKSAEWLSELADGWCAAIALFLKHAHNVDAHFDKHYDFLIQSGLASYISQEIMSDLPDDWRSTLLYASIFDSCTPQMLDFVRPQDDLGRHLTSLRNHLPGLVEDQTGKISLNPLLRLYNIKAFEKLPRLQRADALERAAKCCARVGRVVEAARLVTRVGTLDAIVDFIRRSNGLRLWVTAGTEVIREIVFQAGQLGVEDEPRLQLLKCILHVKDGEIEAAERLLNEAEPRLTHDEQGRQDAAVVRATLMIYGCRVISETDFADLCKAMLVGSDDPAWNSFILEMQCILEMQRGDLDAAVATIVEGMRYARAADIKYSIAYLDIHAANVALARGDLARARILLGQSRKMARDSFSGDTGLQIMIDVLTTSLDFEAGRLPTARLHSRKSTHRMPHVEAWLDIYVAAFEPMARLLNVDVGLASTLITLRKQRDALLAAGLQRIAQLVSALESCLIGEAQLRGASTEERIELPKPGSPDSSLSWQERELFSMANAYAALAAGRPDAAIQTLKAVADFAEARGLRRTLLRLRLLTVAAYDRLNQPQKADSIFEEALALGITLGMSRVFAEVGGDAVRRRCSAQVRLLEAGKIDEPGQTQFLRAIRRWEPAAPAGEKAKLTPRERDVLSALDEGGADKQIGRRLGITEHAVRYHLLHIYRKLGVHDRVAALSRARKSGLLD